MSTPYCTYISTLAGSLAFPDGELLPHCTDEEHFATRVLELMGQNGKDSGTAPFKHADIQAFACKPAEPATQPTTPKPELQKDLRRWAFDTSVLRKVCQIRHGATSSSAESQPSPSEPKTNPEKASEGEQHRQKDFSPTMANLFGTGSSEETSAEEAFAWTEDAAAKFFGKPTQDATGTHHGEGGSGEPKDRAPAEQIPEPAQPVEPADCNPSSHRTGEHEEPTREQDNGMNTDRTIPTFDSLADIKALLCIADPWCGLVATGQKTWELRSFPTSKRH